MLRMDDISAAIRRIVREELELVFRSLELERPANGPIEVSSGRRSGWLTENEASDLTKIPVETLRSWRTAKKHLPYSKIGRLVRYNEVAVNAYVKAREV